MLFSEIPSKELVASSNTIIFLSRYKALAIATLCCWPPEIFIPLSPTKVSTPLGSSSISSLRLAASMELKNFFSSISLLLSPKHTLSLIVSFFKNIFCPT